MVILTAVVILTAPAVLEFFLSLYFENTRVTLDCLYTWGNIVGLARFVYPELLIPNLDQTCQKVPDFTPLYSI